MRRETTNSQEQIGIALSGGGSRAIAFHLGCLKALNELNILEKIDILSTISGGSVIGAYYAYGKYNSFDEFESKIRTILRKGFQKKIFFRLILNPKNLICCFVNFLIAYLQTMFCWVFKVSPILPRYISRTDIFSQVLKKELFPAQKVNSSTRNNIDIVIGACDLRTGTAFRFGNKITGGSRYGKLLKNTIDIAVAVAASAAYPLFLPALDRNWKFSKNGAIRKHRILLTDGGVYDNLGLQVLEPERNPQYSIHSYSCKYLIVCNAGRGTESGDKIQISFFPRIIQSTNIIHRRTQELLMDHLYHLKKEGKIDGFAMPYLGQIDSNLPIINESLILREEVINYPTDFAAMSEEWINAISKRGEQLTRILVSHYLPNLLSN